MFSNEKQYVPCILDSFRFKTVLLAVCYIFDITMSLRSTNNLLPVSSPILRVKYLSVIKLCLRLKMINKRTWCKHNTKMASILCSKNTHLPFCYTRIDFRKSPILVDFYTHITSHTTSSKTICISASVTYPKSTQFYYTSCVYIIVTQYSTKSYSYSSKSVAEPCL